VTSLFDLPFEDAPLDPEDLRPLDTPADGLAPAQGSVGLSQPDVETQPQGGVEGPARSQSGPLPGEGSAGLSEPGVPPPHAPGKASTTLSRPERQRPRVYSVSELTNAVRNAIEQEFRTIWVEGEVADCSEKGGHVYFTLKDQRARLSAVLWRTDALRLRFKLTTGLQVIVKGRLSVYVPSGKYQLYADSIEPRGAGALQLAYEQLRRRLQAEGLFAPARKRALPMLPRRIGIVTSLEGAAVRDIVRVLRTRRAPSEIVISPTRVQGEGASADIARALARLARVPGVDVIIVGRGGGSLEDLWAFNEEVVARAIAACPVPVIAAIGHETDTTIADHVADVRAATPSQGAELVVRQASEFRERIGNARRQMVLLLRSRLDRQRASLMRVEQRPAFARFRDRLLDRDRARADLHERLTLALRDRVHDQRRVLREVTGRLDEQHPQRQLTSRLRRLAQLDERLATAMRTRQAEARQHLQRHRDRLARVGLQASVAQSCRRVDAQVARARQAVEGRWHRTDRRLTTLAGQLHALSPLATLGRGYAICWNADHTAVVRSITAVAPGHRVDVQLPDGTLQCAVEAPDAAPTSRP
jgi:exodeoxyribonuclease VII large subunit